MKKLLLLVSLFFVGNWLVDIGQLADKNQLVLTNGFWTASGAMAWHFGWYLSILCFLLLCFLCILEKEKHQKETNDFLESDDLLWEVAIDCLGSEEEVWKKLENKRKETKTHTDLYYC